MVDACRWDDLFVILYLFFLGEGIYFDIISLTLCTISIVYKRV